MFGITPEEFRTIVSRRGFIRENRHRDPAALALEGAKPCLCTQIRLLQKCRQKLPHYYEACCVIPPVSYEQASSRETALAKDFRGKRLLDLTCGLGADSLAFARSFERVVSLERDPLLAEIARYNFGLLGAENIEVICTDCADYVRNHTGEKFDLVYADPARRDENQRTFLLETCSPNIPALLPDLPRITGRLVVKLSPLFDVEEVHRAFPGATAEAVSLDGECKEVLADLIFGKTATGTAATVLSRNGAPKRFRFDRGDTPDRRTPVARNYLYLADVVFKKCRNTAGLLQNCFAAYPTENYGTVVFSEQPLPDFPGRGYRIGEIFPYKPKTVARQLKKEGIRSATVVKENCPYSVNDIRRSLGVRDGADCLLAVAGLDRETVLLRITETL